MKGSRSVPNSHVIQLEDPDLITTLKEYSMILVGVIALIGWTFPFTAVIFGSVIRNLTKRWTIHGLAMLVYVLAVATFHRYVPGGYPTPICWAVIPCYLLGHWLYHASRQVVLPPESP